MLPLIPQKLWKIDASTVGDHYFLIGSDPCFYIWEYAAQQGFDSSPANDLIWDLKIKPSASVISQGQSRLKREAIAHAGLALRALISRDFVESHATLVPIPCSKVQDDPEYDSRLNKVLDAAFHGWNADVRDMLRFTRSMPADHDSHERLGFDELLHMTAINEVFDAQLRPIIVVFDDVLNSGKHFKVAQKRIRERCPDAEIRGLFLARCIRD